MLRIEGRDAPYRATAVENDPEEIRRWLRHYLGLFPQDADYHDIRLNREMSPVSEDLERASQSAILVEAQPIRS